MPVTIQITYIGSRGIGGYENLLPVQHWTSFESLEEAITTLTKEGFRKTPLIHIPPSAIIDIRQLTAEERK